MKPKFRHLRSLAIASSALLSISYAHAASLYWDSNGTGTAGAGATPSGTWGSSVFWSTDSTGANVGSPVLTATTNSVDDVFFSAGTDAVNPYAISLNSATQNARLVTFEDGTATLSTGTLSLGTGGGITVTTGTVTGATISSGLTLSGSQTFNVAASRTLTLNTGTFTRNPGATLNILSTGTVTSTMTNLSANDATGIIGNWASFNTGTNTTYAKFTGSTITGLGYTGGLDGVTAAASTNVVTGGGNLNYTLNANGTLGASASINTLRYTLAAGGTLTTSTAFTTNGIMNVGGGTLTISGAVTSGTGEMVINAANGGITLSSTLNNNGNLVSITGSGATIITGAISGSGAVSMSGGSLSLNNSNSFNGGFTLNSGFITNINAGTYVGFGSGTFTAKGGTLNFAGSSPAVTINNDLNWGGSLLFTRSSSGTPTPTFNGTLTLSSNLALALGTGTTNSNAIFTNNISGAFSIDINSSGGASPNALTLSGANNTFSGGLTINSASTRILNLSINSATALGATAGTFTINTNNVVIDNTSAAAITLTNNNPLAINGNFTFTGSSDLNMGTGAVNLGSGTRSITVTNTNKSLTLGGVISSGGITKLGAGTLVLSGTSANTYGTITTVSAGILELNKTSNATNAITAIGISATASTVQYAATAGNDQINDGAPVTLANGAGVATLNLNGISDTIGSLTFGGGSGTGTSQGIVTTGAGTLTLGGTVQYTSTGATSMTHSISGNLNLGAATRTFSIQNNGAAIDFDVSAAIAGTGVGLTKTSGGTLQLSGTNTYTGVTTVSAGTLQFAKAVSLYNNNTVPGAGTGWTAANINVASGATLALNVGGTLGEFTTGNVTTLLTNLGGANGTSTTGFAAGSIIAFDTTNAAGNTFTVADLIANSTGSGGGALGLTKLGSNTLVLSNTNTYTGTTSITAGTLSLTGAITGGGAISTSGTGIINQSAAGIISKSSFTQGSSGTSILAGTNTYYGNTTISAGILNANSSAALGSASNILIFNGGTLQAAGPITSPATRAVFMIGAGTIDTNNNAVSIAGAIGAAGALTKSGLGTLTLSGSNNTFTGSTTVSAGTLALTNNLAIQNSALAFTAGTQLDLSGAATPTIGGLNSSVNLTSVTGYNTTVTALTLNPQSGVSAIYSGIISNGAAANLTFTKNGTGTQTLSGPNTYTGLTTINAGTLTITGSLNGTTGTALAFGGTGNFNVNEGASSAQQMTSLALNGGDATVQSTFTSTSSNLTFNAAPTRAAGGTGVFIISAGAIGTSALNAIGTLGTNNIILTGQTGQAAMGVGYFAGTASGSGYAFYDGAGFVRPLDYTNDATPAGAASYSGVNASLASVNYARLQNGGSVTGQLNGTTFTGLHIINSTAATLQAFTLAAGATVTVNGILRTGNTSGATSATTISGGTGIRASSGAEMIIRTDLANDFLTISTPILANGTNALTKSGLGTLRITTAPTYTGATTINGGTFDVSGITSGSAFTPLPTSSIAFTGTSTFIASANASGLLVTYPTMSIANGITATFDKGSTGGNSIYAIPSLTGSGTFSYTNSTASGTGTTLTFTTLAGFTGNLGISQNGGSINTPDLTDTASSKILIGAANANTATNFNYTGSGATTLNNRQFELNGTLDNGLHAINVNNATGTLTINTNLLVSTTGAKTLSLGGTGTGVFGGNIANGAGTITVSKGGSGTWTISGNMSQTGNVTTTAGALILSGNNTYSGNTSPDNSPLTINGKAALSPNSLISFDPGSGSAGGGGGVLNLRMDDSGVVNLGNQVNVRTAQTSAQGQWGIDVRNNGGATTNSTLVLGKLNFGTGSSIDTRSGGQLNVTGANGYGLQLSGVDLGYNISFSWTLNPTTAPLTIAGLVKQINGHAASYLNGTTIITSRGDFLTLGGTASGNLVSGVIQNAADFDDSSNANARPFGIIKSNTSVWNLSGTNTYSGSTTITGGTLIVNSLASGASNSSIGKSSAAAANLVLGAGTLQYAPINAVGGAGATIDRNFTITGSGSIDSSGTGALVFSQTGIISPDVTGLTGTTTLSGTQITGLSSTANLAVGMVVSMTGVPAGRTIVSIDGPTAISLNSGTSVTAGTNASSFGYGARTLTLTGTNTDANTIAGVLQNSTAAGTGVLGLTKSGIGKWVLSGNNTYTGTNTVNVGTLTGTQASGTPFGTGAVALGAGTLSLAPTGSGSNVIVTGGTVAAATAFTFNADSQLTLNKGTQTSLTYTFGTSGTTWVRGTNGTLILSVGAIANLGAVAGSGERFLINGTAPTMVGTANLVSGVVAQDRAVSNAGDFVTYGATNGFAAATPTLTNTFTGSLNTSYVNVTTGTATGGPTAAYAIKVGGTTLTNTGNTITLGSAANNTVAQLILNGGTISGGTITSPGAITGAEFSIYTSGTSVISSAITNTGTSSLGMSVFGPGTLDFSGSSGNTFSGDLRINNSTVIATANTQLGNTTSGVTLTGGTLQTSGTFALGATGQRSITLAAGQDQTGGTFNVTADTTTFTSTTSKVISGSGSLTKTGAGILALATNVPTTNSYTGGTFVNVGTLRLDASSMLADTGAVTVNGASAIFDIQTFSDTVGAVTLTSGSITGTTGVLTGTSYDVRSGTASANLAGTGATMTKSTSGTVTLSGTNTFTGGTTISGGTLQLAKLLSQPASGVVAVGTGTTLAVNVGGTGEWTTATSGVGTIDGLLVGSGGQTVSTVTYTGAVTLGFDTTNASPTTQTYAGVIGNVGTTLGITKLGTNTLTLTNTNTYTGSTTISAGTLIAGAAAPGSGNGVFGHSSGGSLVLGNASTLVGDAPTLLINGVFTVGRDITVGSLANTAAYNATIGGSNTSGASNYTGLITLGTTATNYTATLQAATGGQVTFNTTWNTNNKAIAIGSSGNDGMVRLGTNIATTGGINVNFGNLRLSTMILTGNVTVASGAQLSGTGGSEVTGTTSVTSATVNGNSGLTLTGLTTFNGTGNAMLSAVTSTAGVTLAAGAAVTQTGTLTGNLNTTNTGTFTANGAVTGNATVASGGTLAGTGSIGGTTGVTSGTVNGTGLDLTGLTTFNSTGNILSGTVTSPAGVTLASSAALANSAAVTGGIAVGAGTLTGTGGSFSAASTLNGGTINLTSGSFGSTLGVTGGNWNGQGTVTGAVTSSSGTFTIANGANLTATSGVSATGGALVVNGTLTGALAINSSTTLSGTGTINGAATVDGTHNPGSSPGIQTFTAGLAYGSTAILNAEFVGNTLGLRGTDFDGVNVTGGNLNIDSLASLALYTSSIDYANAAWDVARDFTVIDFSGAGTSTGSFVLNTTNAGSFASEGSWSLANTSNDITLSWAPIPEPSSVALLGTLGAMLLLRRRR